MKLKRIAALMSAGAMAAAVVGAMPVQAEEWVFMSGVKHAEVVDGRFDTEIRSFTLSALTDNYSQNQRARIKVPMWGDFDNSAGEYVEGYVPVMSEGGTEIYDWNGVEIVIRTLLMFNDLPFEVEDVLTMPITVRTRGWVKNKDSVDVNFKILVDDADFPPKPDDWSLYADGTARYTSKYSTSCKEDYYLSSIPKKGEELSFSFTVKGGSAKLWVTGFSGADGRMYYYNGDSEENGSVGGSDGTYEVKWTVPGDMTDIRLQLTEITPGATVTVSPPDFMPSNMPKSDKITSLNEGDEYDVFGIDAATGKLCQRHIKVYKLTDLTVPEEMYMYITGAYFHYTDHNNIKTAKTTRYYTSLGEGFPEVEEGCVILTTYVRGATEKLSCDVELDWYRDPPDGL